MAAAVIPVTNIDRSGGAPPAEVAMDVANGNVLPNNNGQMWVEVTNSTGSTKTLTVQQPNKQDGVSSPGKVYSLATTVKRRIGPFPVGTYGTDVLFNAEAASTMTIMGYQVGA
jgi:hypothetical protein